MRYLLLLLMTMITPALAQSVISDPIDARYTHCGVYMDSAPRLVISVTPIASMPGKNHCNHSVKGLPLGTHTVKMTGIINDPIAGEKESPQSLPFTFVLPVPPLGAPDSFRLVPQ